MQPAIINDATLNRGRSTIGDRWRWVLLCCAVIGLWVASSVQPVWAEPASGLAPATNNFVQPTRGSGRIIGLNQAIRIAQEESGGQVLSAKSVRRPNGVLHHKVRVLVDGQRVMTMVVDQNGRLRRGR